MSFSLIHKFQSLKWTWTSGCSGIQEKEEEAEADKEEEAENRPPRQPAPGASDMRRSGVLHKEGCVAIAGDGPATRHSYYKHLDGARLMVGTRS